MRNVHSRTLLLCEQKEVAESFNSFCKSEANLKMSCMDSARISNQLEMKICNSNHAVIQVSMPQYSVYNGWTFDIIPSSLTYTTGADLKGYGAVLYSRRTEKNKRQLINPKRIEIKNILFGRRIYSIQQMRI